MMLTTLAAIARSAGLRVVEQPGWTTRGHGQMSGVRAIVCHHTAGSRTGNAPSLGVVQNGRSDLAGPLAHFVLGRDGTVYVVAAGLCWHAGAVLNSAWGNAYSIGIEAEATGTEAWPAVQLDAYARLCKALCVAFGLPGSAVLGHKEVCSPRGRKSDPNFDMTGFRARVAAVGTAPAGRPDTEEDELNDLQASQLDYLFRVAQRWPADAPNGQMKDGKWTADQAEVGRANFVLLHTLKAQLDGLVAAVAALSKDNALTADAVRKIIDDAVERGLGEFEAEGSIVFAPKSAKPELVQ